VDYYGPTFDVVPDSGTAHINVLAPDGAAVSLTGSINLLFVLFIMVLFVKKLLPTDHNYNIIMVLEEMCKLYKNYKMLLYFTRIEFLTTYLK